MSRWYVELLKYQDRLRAAMLAAGICVFEVDIPAQKYTFFENAEEIFGISGDRIMKEIAPFSALPPEEYKAAVSEYFVHPEDFDAVEEAFHKMFEGKSHTYFARMKAGKGEYRWCRVRVIPKMKGDVPEKMIGVITNVHEMKSRMDEIEKESQQDFTGIYNKKYAQICIQGILEKKKESLHAMILFDLDHFKLVNDTYGHQEGDKILCSVAGDLQGRFRGTDILSRFGGDEFMIFLQDIPGEEWLEAELQRLLEQCGNLHGTTKSIGAAIFPWHGTSYEELLKNADIALYEAKKKRNSFQIYEEDSTGCHLKRSQ